MIDHDISDAVGFLLGNEHLLCIRLHDVRRVQKAGSTLSNERRQWKGMDFLFCRGQRLFVRDGERIDLALAVVSFPRTGE